MSTPSSIWLLFILIKQRPPKAKTPPLSLLFAASYVASPSKQTNDSKRNLDGSRPAHGVGERQRHDLVAPLLHPWREMGQSRWRVGGMACLVGCCVYDVCCVLCFALQLMTLHGGQDDSILSTIQAKWPPKLHHQRNSCQILQNPATESRWACSKTLIKNSPIREFSILIP